MLKTKINNELKEIHELYKRNSAGTDKEYIGELYQVSKKNLFDMRYNVSYQGMYPNITEVAGGKSTEWIETAKFTNPYGYYSLNPATPSALCVFGLVYSNDKTTILYRDGRRNTADLPTNTQYFGTTAIDKSYTYVKFYVSSWSTMNNAGVYISQTEYEPYMLHTFSAGYDTIISGTSPLTLSNARAKATSWEINGKSSQSGTPTPTNPVDVNGCGDKTENLYDGTITNFANAGAVGVNDNYRSITVPVTAGETYTFKRMSLPPTASTNRCGYFFTKEYPYSGLAIFSEAALVETTMNFSVTAPDECTYFTAYFDVGGIDISGTQMMFVKGSTVPTEYIPYGYRVPILQANNCGAVDLGTIENLTYRGDLGEGVFFVNTNWWGNPKKELGIKNLYLNGYTISESGATEMGDMTICGHRTAYVLYIRDTRYNNVESFKAAMSGKYLYYQRTTDTSWNTPTITNITLPAPLQKIGTYKDSIESDGTLTRGVGVKVLDGTETWYYDQTWSRFFTVLSGLPSQTETARIVRGFSTHYEWIYDGRSISRVTAGQGYFGYISGGDSGVYLHDSHTSIAEFESWLAAQYAAGTPVVIYYPLATPTETSVVMPTISTSQGTNYLAVETEVSPSNIEVTYRKKTQ